jgi:hypothetical protein
MRTSIGFRAPDFATRPRSSRASSRTKRIPEQRRTRTLLPTLQQMKTKVTVTKSKFEDQEDSRTTQDEDAAANAAADAVIPAIPPHGGASTACPPPGGKGTASKRAAGGGGRMLGPKADAG